LEHRALYLLMGPRRVGKSVAMKRTIAELIEDGVDPKRVVFCPCEGLSRQDLIRVIKLAADLTPGIADGERYWFFDEITYVPNWDEVLKQLRDQTLLRQGTVIATGSSGANLRAAQGELGGREGTGDTRFMWPMGFRPFLSELYSDLAAELPRDRIAIANVQTEATKGHLQHFGVFVDDLAIAWERYLTIGGFPRAVADAHANVDVQRATANSLWNILVGEVLHVGKMSDRDVKALLARLVEAMGSPLSVANIAEHLAIGSRNTVDDRIDRLCGAFYAWRAATTHDGLRPVRGGQSKLYFIDPLVARLPSIRDGAITAPDMTKLNEQQVGTALIRALSREHQAAVMDESIALVRRNPDSGAEIDFVGDLVDTPIESKYVSQRWKRERQALGDTYQRGVVATRDILDTADDIWAIPSGLLVWLIDG
jgi:predicted AAA+ superfamily ATPase